jgi:diketogulonate reductase-like aldo/keto reductase
MWSNFVSIIFFGGSLAIGDSLLDNLHTVYVSNEIQMPRIGFGTAALGQLTEEMTCAALDSGVRLIDSAQAREWYREDSVGKAIQSCYNEQYQSHLVVVTKIHPRSYM